MKKLVLLLCVALLAIASSCKQNVEPYSVPGELTPITDAQMMLINSVDSASLRHAIVADDYVIVLGDKSYDQAPILVVKSISVNDTVFLTIGCCLAFAVLLILVIAIVKAST